MIFFVDQGSDKNGELYIEMTPASEKYVQSITYKVYHAVPLAVSESMEVDGM